MSEQEINERFRDILMGLDNFDGTKSQRDIFTWPLLTRRAYDTAQAAGLSDEAILKFTIIMLHEQLHKLQAERIEALQLGIIKPTT